MAENSKIAWCDDTFNGWIGCEEVRLKHEGFLVPSECDNCYAKFLAFNRMGYNGNTLPVLWGPKATTPRHKTSKTYWNKPDAWEKIAAKNGRRLVFCFSLSDWAEDHPMVGQWRKDLFDIIERCPHLDFQLLTKRPVNIKRMIPDSWKSSFPQNVWMGTSTGTQIGFDLRWKYLAECRDMGAPVTFLSMEPLLESIDPSPALKSGAVNWIITGGESGGGSDRPRINATMDWFRLIRDVTVENETAFLHKQFGGSRPGGDASIDGRLWHQFPTASTGALGGVRAEVGAELIA